MVFPPGDGSCRDCGRDDETVERRSTDGATTPLCTQCYIDQLADTQLSPRESEVYAYADSGFTNTEIATELDIDESTVGTHLAKIRKKYGEAVQLASTIEPASLFSGTTQSTLRDFPEGIERGAVVKLQHINEEPEPADAEYTHGIIRRVFRAEDGLPTRIAVYPFNPNTGEIRISNAHNLPEVIDCGTFGTVVFPIGTLLKDTITDESGE